MLGRYTPKGSYSEIAGLGVYHSKAQDRNDGSKLGNILFLPDGFGLSAHNLRLADMYAEQGKQLLKKIFDMLTDSRI